jgi:hypothetical protein
LIERRCARKVNIAGADEFFDELKAKLQAIEALNRPHPLSAELGIAMLKEYLPEPRYRIRLRRLLGADLRRTGSAL